MKATVNTQNNLKMNWLRLEDRIRQQLKIAAGMADARDLSLIISEISDILGEETGRGYEIPEDWWKHFEQSEVYETLEAAQEAFGQTAKYTISVNEAQRSALERGVKELLKLTPESNHERDEVELLHGMLESLPTDGLESDDIADFTA